MCESCFSPSFSLPILWKTEKGLCATVLFYQPPTHLPSLGVYLASHGMYQCLSHCSAPLSSQLPRPLTDDTGEICLQNTLGAAPPICLFSPQKAWQRKLFDREQFPLGLSTLPRYHQQPWVQNQKLLPQLYTFLSHLFAQVCLYNSTFSLQVLPPWKLWKIQKHEGTYSEHTVRRNAHKGLEKSYSATTHPPKCGASRKDELHPPAPVPEQAPISSNPKILWICS